MIAADSKIGLHPAEESRHLEKDNPFTDWESTRSREKTLNVEGGLPRTAGHAADSACRYKWLDGDARCVSGKSPCAPCKHSRLQPRTLLSSMTCLCPQHPTPMSLTRRECQSSSRSRCLCCVHFRRRGRCQSAGIHPSHHHGCLDRTRTFGPNAMVSNMDCLAHRVASHLVAPC